MLVGLTLLDDLIGDGDTFVTLKWLLQEWKLTLKLIITDKVKLFGKLSTKDQEK